MFGTHLLEFLFSGICFRYEVATSAAEFVELFFASTYSLELFTHGGAMRSILGDSCSEMRDDGCGSTEDVLYDLSEPVQKTRKHDSRPDHLLLRVPMFSALLRPWKNQWPVAGDCTGVSTLGASTGNDLTR